MNIFVLDNDPRLAAIWQHDRHVVKMILESAQMLSTATRTQCDSEIPDFDAGLTQEQFDSLYKSTHMNHPCNIWVRESWANFAWLTVHLDSLVTEYHRRFQKIHATDRLRWLFGQIVAKHVGQDRFWTRDADRNLILAPGIMDLANQHTPFAVCMPDEFKVIDEYKARIDAIESYRNLYIGSKIHQSHVKWTRCASLPEFILEHVLYDSRVETLYEAHKRQMAAGYHPATRPIKPSRPAIVRPIGEVNPKANTRFFSK